ncbi:hypothetical protein ACWDUL_20830 [Nocardia niigatensis]
MTALPTRTAERGIGHAFASSARREPPTDECPDSGGNPQMNMALREDTHRDCTTDPGGFVSGEEAYAVLRFHAEHGPRCLPFLAAHAYVADGTDD